MAGEKRKIKDRIINTMRKKIVANLKSISDYKKEISGKAKKYPALQKEIVSFLKNYEEIENGVSQLDTIEKALLYLKNSQNLLKEDDKLRGKILLDTFFEER